MNGVRLLTSTCLFLVVAFASSVNASSRLSCSKILVSEAKYPFNFGLISQKWSRGRPSYPSFEAVSLFYVLTNTGSQKITTQRLVQSLAELQQSSFVRATRYVSQMRSAGFLNSEADREDQRRKDHILSESGQKLFLDFLNERGVSPSEVQQFMNFRIKKWASYTSSLELSSLLYGLYAIEINPAGVAADAISSGLRKIELAPGAKDLVLKRQKSLHMSESLQAKSSGLPAKPTRRI